MAGLVSSSKKSIKELTRDWQRSEEIEGGDSTARSREELKETADGRAYHLHQRGMCDSPEEEEESDSTKRLDTSKYFKS